MVRAFLLKAAILIKQMYSKQLNIQLGYWTYDKPCRFPNSLNKKVWKVCLNLARVGYEYYHTWALPLGTCTCTLKRGCDWGLHMLHTCRMHHYKRPIDVVSHSVAVFRANQITKKFYEHHIEGTQLCFRYVETHYKICTWFCYYFLSRIWSYNI